MLLWYSPFSSFPDAYEAAQKDAQAVKEHGGWIGVVAITDARYTGAVITVALPTDAFPGFLHFGVTNMHMP